MPILASRGRWAERISTAAKHLGHLRIFYFHAKDISSHPNFTVVSAILFLMTSKVFFGSFPFQNQKLPSFSYLLILSLLSPCSLLFTLFISEIYLSSSLFNLICFFLQVCFSLFCFFFVCLFSSTHVQLKPLLKSELLSHISFFFL